MKRVTAHWQAELGCCKRKHRLPVVLVKLWRKTSRMFVRHPVMHQALGLNNCALNTSKLPKLPFDYFILNLHLTYIYSLGCFIATSATTTTIMEQVRRSSPAISHFPHSHAQTYTTVLAEQARSQTPPGGQVAATATDPAASGDEISTSKGKAVAMVCILVPDLNEQKQFQIPRPPQLDKLRIRLLLKQRLIRSYNPSAK